MIPVCDTSGRFGTEVYFPIFSEPFEDLSLVCRFMRQVVDSGAFIRYVFGCLFSNSAFLTDGVYCVPYFVQPVL